MKILHKQKQNASKSPSKPAGQPHKSGNHVKPPPFSKSDRPQNSGGAQQKAAQKPAQKNDNAFKYPSKPISSRPPSASKEASDKNEGHSNQPQEQQHIPGLNSAKGKWDHQVDSAKRTWGKLSHYELLNSDGEEQALINLVQKRYAISRDEAGKQVREFFVKQRS